jgi:hypothetical protein
LTASFCAASKRTFPFSSATFWFTRSSLPPIILNISTPLRKNTKEGTPCTLNSRAISYCTSTLTVQKTSSRLSPDIFLRMGLNFIQGPDHPAQKLITTPSYFFMYFWRCSSEVISTTSGPNISFSKDANSSMGASYSGDFILGS